MRALFALVLLLLALLLVAFLLLVRPAWASAVRCFTYKERFLSHWQTVCDDGSRAVSYWNMTLRRRSGWTWAY